MPAMSSTSPVNVLPRIAPTQIVFSSTCAFTRSASST